MNGQIQQFTLRIDTVGRCAKEITQDLNDILSGLPISTGLAHVFLQHTSASLMLCENADSTVLADLENVLQRLAPDGDPAYQHNYEGDDDMAAHIRSILTTNDLTLPVKQGMLALGTWQGVYLYEHRYQPHQRHLILSVQGNHS